MQAGGRGDLLGMTLFTVRDLKRAVVALATPEPDEPLPNHPENVEAWQRWNDERLWALELAKELR